MSQYFEIHPDNPQARLIQQAVEIIRDGGVVVLPTDSSYAIACHLDDKSAVERIRAIRDLDKKHNFTLVCRDLSEIATYARVDNTAYRLLKAYTPGPYTFLLRATATVPRRLQHPKRKTVGIRVPDHPVITALLMEHGQPLMSVDADPARQRVSGNRWLGDPRAAGKPCRPDCRWRALRRGADHRDRSGRVSAGGAAPGQGIDRGFAVAC